MNSETKQWSLETKRREGDTLPSDERKWNLCKDYSFEGKGDDIDQTRLHC